MRGSATNSDVNDLTSIQSGLKSHAAWLLPAAFLASALLCLPHAVLADQDERDEPVRIGVPPWQGAEVKSAVVAEILRRAGYQVELSSAAAPLVFQELAQGRLEFNLSAWVPGQDEAFGPHVEAGRIVVIGENLTGASTGLAIPAALAPDGLDSLEDLDRYADDLQQTVFCIEPGSGAMAVLEQARDEDIYGLQDWRALASSTEGMLTQVRRSIRRGNPLVFCAWRPHWMNVAFDLHYLDDPLEHWGGPDGTRVYTLGRHDLADDYPALVAFLERFRVNAAVQSDWIHAYAVEERRPEEIARAWIDAHADQVDAWWGRGARED